MVKLGWKVSQTPLNLAQKYINKYVHGNKVTKFSHGSNTCKSIGKGWHLIFFKKIIFGVWERGK